MRLQLISDLHTEFRPGNEIAMLESLPIEKNLDFLVVAGDLFGLAAQGSLKVALMFRTLAEMARHVLYVSGNHEYYGTTKERFDRELEAILDDKPKIHWLRNQQMTFDGVTFIGGTMWFRPRPDDVVYARMLSDFSAIRDDFPTWAYRENYAFRELVHGFATENTVVVTHHMPSSLATPPAFANSPINRFFVSDESMTIYARKPRLWLFGHTHVPYEGMLDKTRLLCNPLGYPRERTDGYPPVVVDV